MNILLTADIRAKITDLGSAKLQERTALSTLSVDFNQRAAFPPESERAARAPASAGAEDAGFTPAQRRELRRASFKWDVWQFGVVVLEVLSGDLWTNAGTLDEAMYADKVARLIAGLPVSAAPEVVRGLVRGCLEWDPARRPGTADLYPALLGPDGGGAADAATAEWALR